MPDLSEKTDGVILGWVAQGETSGRGTTERDSSQGSAVPGCAMSQGTAWEMLGTGQRGAACLCFGRNILGYLVPRLEYPCIHLWSCHRNHSCARSSISRGPECVIELCLSSGGHALAAGQSQQLALCWEVWGLEREIPSSKHSTGGLWPSPVNIAAASHFHNTRPTSLAPVGFFFQGCREGTAMVPLPSQPFPEATEARKNFTLTTTFVVWDPKSWSCIGDADLINELVPWEHRMDRINQALSHQHADSPVHLLCSVPFQ